VCDSWLWPVLHLLSVKHSRTPLYFSALGGGLLTSVTCSVYNDRGKHRTVWTSVVVPYCLTSCATQKIVVNLMLMLDTTHHHWQVVCNCMGDSMQLHHLAQVCRPSAKFKLATRVGWLIAWH
jgi:hypothetical protein